VEGLRTVRVECVESWRGARSNSSS